MINNCDKCGLPVSKKNNAVYVAIEAGEIHGFSILTAQSRHFLPEGTCPGSPSRAQYIEGQPRDTRGYDYNSHDEEIWRSAYAKLQAGEDA